MRSSVPSSSATRRAARAPQREDVVDGGAVAPREGTQVRSPLLDLLEPGGVDVGVGEVGPEVGRDVGGEVAQLVDAGADLGERGVAVADRREPRGRRGERLDHAGRRHPARVLVTGDRGVGGAGAVAQPLGVAEPLRLARSTVVLARPGVDRLDPLQADAQRVGLSRPLGRGGAQVGSSASASLSSAWTTR